MTETDKRRSAHAHLIIFKFYSKTAFWFSKLNFCNLSILECLKIIFDKRYFISYIFNRNYQKNWRGRLEILLSKFWIVKKSNNSCFARIVTKLSRVSLCTKYISIRWENCNVTSVLFCFFKKKVMWDLAFELSLNIV